MKAVIWTDVIQATMMFIGIIISIVFGMCITRFKFEYDYVLPCHKGLIDAGGITKVFNTLAAGDRLQITTYVYFLKSIEFSVILFIFNKNYQHNLC